MIRLILLMLTIYLPTETIESFFVVSKGIMQMTKILNCGYNINMKKMGKIAPIIAQRGLMIWDG